MPAFPLTYSLMSAGFFVTSIFRSAFDSAYRYSNFGSMLTSKACSSLLSTSIVVSSLLLLKSNDDNLFPSISIYVKAGLLLKSSSVSFPVRPSFSSMDTPKFFSLGLWLTSNEVISLRERINTSKSGRLLTSTVPLIPVKARERVLSFVF